MHHVFVCAGGSVVAIDRDSNAMETAKSWARDAGVFDCIEWRVGEGDDQLGHVEQQIHEGRRDMLDFAFVDADKRGNSSYVERLARMVRQGGLIMVDNVLWYGKVADENDFDNSTAAIRALNDSLLNDERFDHSTIPVADGVTLLRVR